MLHRQMQAVLQQVSLVRAQLKKYGEEIREAAEAIWSVEKYNRLCVLMRNVQTKKPMSLQKDVLELLEMMHQLQADLKTEQGA